MKRIFLAIKLIPDENLLRLYYSLLQSLRYDKIRWVDPANFHLTLKFFGSTPEEKIPVISKVAASTVKPYGGLTLKIENAGVFGSSYKPRVIWFGIAENKQLQRLGRELLDNLDDVGFLKDRQNFVPHITVGRISKITDKHLFNNEMKKAKNVFLQQTTVDRLVLFESVLSSGGPIYKELDSFPMVA